MPNMQVRVLFFGQLKELVGFGDEWTEVSDGARVEDLFQRYGRKFPKLGEFRASVAASINQEYAGWRDGLSNGDEIAFLPPVSGGEAAPAPVPDPFQFVRDPIHAAPFVHSIAAPEDGAVIVFEGIVRNNWRGRRTLYLEYEAYEPMALAKIRQIGADAREKFRIHAIAIVHRLGRIPVGETSVLIAVSSPHRAAAFEACRFAIDTLKSTVPIWKKEFFTDGSVWADGETPGAEPGPAPSAPATR
jgi:molybdopterin synthase catalytic subunit/molybdopterin converting factor small subunit